MDAGTGSALEAEVARRVLSEHERRLLERANNGKSPAALAQLYRGVYDGENGVREAVETVRGKVRAAINARAGGERPLSDHLAAALDPDDNSGGIHVRSVPAGTIGGADARPTPSASAPPRPERPPSTERLPAVNDSPAPASGFERFDRRAVPRGDRERQVRDALAGCEMTIRELADATGAPLASVTDIIARLRVSHDVERVRQIGRAWVYALVVSSSREVATREPEPPPPFAGGDPEPAPTPAVRASERDLAVRDYRMPEPTLPEGLYDLAVNRYAHVLIDRLAQMETPSTDAPHLMDRIERVLGLTNGRPEQTQIAAGGREAR